MLLIWKVIVWFLFSNVHVLVIPYEKISLLLKWLMLCFPDTFIFGFTKHLTCEDDQQWRPYFPYPTHVLCVSKPMVWGTFFFFKGTDKLPILSFRFFSTSPGLFVATSKLSKTSLYSTKPLLLALPRWSWGTPRADGICNPSNMLCNCLLNIASQSPASF